MSNTILVIGSFDCNDRTHTILEEFELGVAQPQWTDYGGPTVDIATQGVADESALVQSRAVVKISGDDQQDTIDRLNALRDELRAADTTATFGLPAMTSTVELRLKRSPRIDHEFTERFLATDVAQVEVRVWREPWCYSPTDTLIGNLISPANPLGSSWFPEYTEGEYGSGDAVIGLRFDDIPATDYTLIFPMLEERGLIGGFSAVPIWLDESGRLTTAQLAKIESRGHEVMCHSLSHLGAPADLDAFEAETLGGKEALEALGFTVAAFIFPGTWGLYDASTNPYGAPDATAYYGSSSDRSLRANFSAYAAYIGPMLRTLPMTASDRFGRLHQTIDDLSAATVTAQIDTAIAGGYGLQLNCHSFQIGESGYMSESDFGTVLDYIETKVAAGTVTNVTPTQVLFAVEGS